MRAIGLQLFVVALLGVTGCAYTVPVTPVEIDPLSNRQGTRVPGEFSVQIETKDCCKKEVRSELLMCQAPTYHINGDETIKASVESALPAIFENAAIGQNGQINDLTISISQFDVAVRFDPLGVVPTVQATADVGFVLEAKRNGQILLTGQAYAQHANSGRVVLFCAEASSTIAAAVNTATREALGKLAEMMVNSPTLRELGGPSPQKRAQVK